MDVSKNTVAVFGAAGHTGRFVVEELRRRGFRPILVGRDRSKLERTAADGELVRLAGTEDANTLDQALGGARAVINCAGPFLDTALPVLDAALRAGIPYLDVTPEQGAVQRVLAERGAAASEAKVVVVPAAAFYGGLADLLATAAAKSLEKVDEIAVGVALNSWHPTKGTRITGARNTAKRLVQRDGRLTEIDTPPLQGRWTFPAPFGDQDVVMLPFSETITIGKHLQANTILSWINLVPLTDIRDPATPPPVAADASGRSSQQFMMDVVVREGNRYERVTATGRDIYAVSAPIIVEATQRLLAGHPAEIVGVRSLAEIFDPHDFLAALNPEPLAVEYGRAKGSLLHSQVSGQ